MKRLLACVLCLVFLAGPVSAQSIDVRSAIPHGGASEVLSWPPVASLDSFGLVPCRMSIRTSGTAGWPKVDPNDTGDGQAGTLWLLLNMGGQWHATGAERLRKSQINGDKPEACPGEGTLADLVGSGWLYDAGRWGVMAGRNPQPGELVGAFVASGSSRSDEQFTVRQRTNAIVFRWPNNSGSNPVDVVWREDDAPAPVPTPQPSPRPQPAPTQTIDFNAIVEQWARWNNENDERRYLDMKAEAKAEAERDAAHDGKLQKHADDAGVLVSFFTSAKTYIGIAAALAGYLAKGQMQKVD